MLKNHRIYLPATILLIASLACALPSGLVTPDPNALSTAVAQTLVAGLTQTIPEMLSSATQEFTPTITFTMEPPTLTSTATSTLTQTPTSTLEIPMVSVSVPTNCRNGPGKVYVMVGALLVGQAAQVYGRDPTSNYWYIRNPDSDAGFCWVWGEYATLTGPFLLLPIYTPPPTPTATLTPLPTFTPTPSPSFKAEYSSLDTCNGSWWTDIKLKNNGSTPFKSVNISIKDSVTSITLVALTDGFTDIDGCLKSTTKDKIDTGDTYLLSAPAFNYNPAGHELLANITLCSDTGQKGLCTTRNINFTP
jgi:hypothetical protein